MKLKWEAGNAVVDNLISVGSSQLKLIVKHKKRKWHAVVELVMQMLIILQRVHWWKRAVMQLGAVVYGTRPKYSKERAKTPF